jgi:hypothetical protein
VGPDDLLNDRQAQAAAAASPCARRVGPVEPLEDPGQVLRRDPRAGIDHRDLDRLAGAGPEGDPPAGGRVPKGVVDQILEALAKPGLVALQDERGIR